MQTTHAGVVIPKWMRRMAKYGRLAAWPRYAASDWNGSPIAARDVQVIGTGRQGISTRTSANGAVTAKLKLTKRTVVKAVAVIEPEVPEPFLVQSRNVMIVAPKTRHPNVLNAERPVARASVSE